MKLKAYRQGDVLFYQVPEIPSSDWQQRTRISPDKDGYYVLALGEVTGHRHRVSGRTSKMIRMGSRRFLDVPRKAIIKHEEHKPLPLPEGKYEVVIQREYEIGGTQRAVAD